MIKKITCCFSWELKDHLSWFLKYHASFVNTKERLTSYQLPALKKTSFLRWTPFKKSLFWKFIIWTFPFSLIWTILLCKVHFFHNNFSLSFTETHLSIHLLKDLLNIRFLSSYSIIYIYIYYIRNNWLGPIFFSPGDSRTKGLFVLLHLGLKKSLRLTLIENGSLCPLRLLPLIWQCFLCLCPFRTQHQGTAV